MVSYFCIHLVISGAHGNVFHCAQAASKVVVELFAPAVVIVQFDLILIYKILALRKEIAGLLPAHRRKHRGVETTADKLAVHDEVAQDRLPALPQSHNYAVKILHSPPALIKTHTFPGRTQPDHCPRHKFRSLEHIYIPEAVLVFRDLQHGGDDLLSSGQSQARFCRGDFHLFKRVFEF